MASKKMTVEADSEILERSRIIAERIDGAHFGARMATTEIEKSLLRAISLSHTAEIALLDQRVALNHALRLLSMDGATRGVAAFGEAIRGLRTTEEDWK